MITEYSDGIRQQLATFGREGSEINEDDVTDIQKFNILLNVMNSQSVAIRHPDPDHSRNMADWAISQFAPGLARNAQALTNMTRK